MNIAFIHFHLMRGGVTTVIRHQVETLKAAGWDAMVICGRPCEDDFPARVEVIPELGYDQWHATIRSPEDIADDILSCIRGYWPQGADIVHIHNPTLAKNRHLQQVLEVLQQRGSTLLCQIHDFAEDGRPNTYYESPYVKDCHYAVINQRDFQLLLRAGLIHEGCHLLPNTITSKWMDVQPMQGGDYVLYPVRAIRRKNIGEALLVSHFFDKGLALAITLPPNSPADVASYSNWRSYAERRNLPVRFEVGLHADFSELMRDCRFVLTTSITEGFGFVFMEPWGAGKALWGRLLPETCKGFVEEGIELTHLYDCLRIDLQWLDALELERRWKDALAGAAKRFKVPLSIADLDCAWQEVSIGGQFDFGLLNESFQQQVIDRILDDATAEEQLRALNPYLNRPGPPDSFQSVIDHNKNIITNGYNTTTYGRRLRDVYGSVLDTTVDQAIDKRLVSKFFLSPRSFSLLKWEAFDG